MASDTTPAKGTSAATSADVEPPAEAPALAPEPAAPEAPTGDPRSALQSDGTPANPVSYYHKSFWSGIPNLHCPFCSHKTTLSEADLVDHIFKSHPEATTGEG